MTAAPLLLAVALAGPTAPPDASQEPLVAGSDVKAPRRVTFVQPEYPPEAQARGLRGIVILELLIDEEGRVADVAVVRSVPPFDEAAIEAARQWKYEVTRVDGVPVKVRLTVPITFAVRLPSMERASGVPELRQGVSPSCPEGARAGVVTAWITLAPDGQVVDALIESGDSPLANALLAAIRTWRFAASPDGSTTSFRLNARFAPGSDRGSNGRVELRLSDPQTSAAPAAPADAAAGGGPGGQSPRAGTPAPGPEEAPSAAEPAPATPVPAPQEPPPPPSEDSGVAPSTELPAPASPPAPAAEVPEAEVPPEPETDVIANTPRPDLPQPQPRSTQPGISAVRDVHLGEGIPDLVTGRRPVVPPFARMARVSGTVRVSFSVDAAGACLVRTVDGPDLLEPAAEDTVGSWTFRRTDAERLFLVAELTYTGDEASASVHFQQ
jgi:TonB family protein